MVASSALVVICVNWHLVKPRPVGPAIGNAVCVVVTLAHMVGLALENF